MTYEESGSRAVESAGGDNSSHGRARLVNLRDVGGLPLRGGGETRCAVLYRADASYTGDTAPQRVPAWPPGTVIDLRSEAEVVRWRYEWPSSTNVVVHPLHDRARPDQMPTDADLSAIYDAILGGASHRIARVVDAVAESSGPVLIHCAAGKDRTGIVVAALLAAAGVERDAIVADYVASEVNLPLLKARWQQVGMSTRPGRHVPEALLAAPATAVGRVLDRVEGWPGGASTWWVDHGATPAHLATWRSRIRGERYGEPRTGPPLHLA
jgi:protein-tyrosine phosphatase